jgi:hypothetical protein
MNLETYRIPILGLLGAVSTVTLSELNLLLGFFTGVLSLCYIIIKFWKELREDRKQHEPRED